MDFCQNIKENRRKLIIFFPITIYLFIGITLYFILYQFSRVIEIINQFAGIPPRDDVKALKYHEGSLSEIFAFPVFGPVIFFVLLLYFFRSIYWTFINVIKIYFIRIAEYILSVLRIFVKHIWDYLCNIVSEIRRTILSIFRKDTRP